MKTSFFLLAGLFICLQSYGQEYFFLPIKEDFLLYQISNRQIARQFNYHKTAMRGVLWRPTSDMAYIFAKNIPEGALLIRMSVFDKRPERFYHKSGFTDFQVINRNAIVVRSGGEICLWNLSTGKCTTLISNFHGLNFFYDIKRQVLITQDTSNILVLHFIRSEKEQKFLDKIEEKTHFTFFAGKLTYLNSPTSWIVYSLDTQNAEQYSLATIRNVRAVWTAGQTLFLIKESLPNSPTEIPGWKLSLYEKEDLSVSEIFTQPSTPQSGGVTLESNSLIAPLDHLSTLIR